MQHAPAPACDCPPLSKTCLSKTYPQFSSVQGAQPCPWRVAPEEHPEEKPYLPELGWEEWHSFSSSISSSVKEFTRRHTLGVTVFTRHHTLGVTA